MRSCTRRAGVIVAFAIAGLFGAPSATADPSVPGDPTGQIYTPPGYIGYYPGVYGLQSIWSLTPPPRVRDAGASDVSIVTMDRGFCTVDEHLDFLAAAKARADVALR